MSSFQEGRLYISFGALAEPIGKQVKELGLRVDPGRVDSLQAHADAIVRLKINSILTDGEAHKAYRRLMKAIVSATTVC